MVNKDDVETEITELLIEFRSQLEASILPTDESALFVYEFECTNQELDDIVLAYTKKIMRLLNES